MGRLSRVPCRVVILAGALGGFWPAAALATAFDAPRSGATLESFAPAGWSVERSEQADLDADGKPDAVLVLIEDAKGDGARRRAIVVVLRRAKGYVLGGTSATLLASSGEELGVKAEDVIQVQGGVLLVTHLQGSPAYASTLRRFRWSKPRAGFELIGTEDRETEGPGESRARRCDLLAGECVETLTAGETPTVTKTRIGKKPLRLIEEL